MTEKEFYEEFGNIDPELIEAAAPKARKRKKILAVRLIAVAACLTVITISAFMIVPRPVSYVVYADLAYSEEITNLSSLSIGEREIVLRSSKEISFSRAAKTSSEKKEALKGTKSFSILGKEWSLVYTGSYSTAESEKIKNVLSYDSYIDENSLLEINPVTNEIAFFRDGTINRNTTPDKCDKEQAEAKADDIIKQLYGEDVLDSYKHSDTIETKDGSSKHYTVVYKRYIHGCPTDDSILISIDKGGEFLSVNAITKGLFLNSEKEITKKEAEAAIAALNSAFAENWSLGEPSLTRDSKGDYYVECLIYRNNNGQSESLQIYINVQ